MTKTETVFAFLIAGALSPLCSICFGNGPSPESIHPASDTSNSGGWVLNKDMSDEFESQRLDTAKWYVEGTDGKYKRWIGRAPAQVSPNNVRVEDGKLRITTKWDPEFDYSTKTKLEYKSPYKKYPFAVHDRATGGGADNAWKDSAELDWRVADDFHVYGCDWSEDGLKFYADEKLVKAATRAELGKFWVLTQPLTIWVDSETF